VVELLMGVPAEEKRLKEKVQSIFEKPNYQFTGTTPDDLVRLVLQAVGKAN